MPSARFVLPSVPPLPSRAPRRLAALLALLATVAAACSEQLDGGEACPALCPVTNTALVDTVLDAVALDSTISGYPVPGEASGQLLALERGPDTLDVRAVVRFDSLPARYFPPSGGDSLAITTADSTVLSLRLDTAGTRYTQPVTIEAYDVDTSAAADTVTAALTALFRPGRRLGSVTLTPGTAVDSVRLRLSDSALVAKVTGTRRLRVGLRLVSTASARVRFATAQGSGTQGGRISFDPLRDTSYRPVLVTAASATPSVAQVAAGFRDFSFVAASARPAVGTDLVVSGVQGRRAYLRFAVPRRIADSTTIVRATLELVQRPARGVPAADSVTLRAQAVVATDAVADARLSANLVAAPALLALDSLRLSPADSATRAISLVALVRAWRAFPEGTQRALVLRGQLEGLQAGELRFFSTEAARALRPRLRLSYIPRTDFGLP